MRARFDDVERFRPKGQSAPYTATPSLDAPDGPMLTASQPLSNRLEENSGVDLVDESYSINEPLSFAPSFIQSQNQFHNNQHCRPRVER